MNDTERKGIPKEIYFEEPEGTNGIICLDYENQSNIKFIREDVVEIRIKEAVEVYKHQKP